MSLFILVILAGIGISLFFAQFRHNPALLSNLDIQNQESDTNLQFQISNFKFQIPEIFDSGNLSDKINGKAELYLSAGFLRLECQRFSEIGNSDLWAEIFIYDMGNASNAFSVFSVQRRENAEALELTPFSYRTENAVFLAHSSYYVEIVSSDTSEKIFEAMRSVAESFVRNILSETQPISETDLFPKPGLVENSISLLSANVFGYDRMDNVFTALYKFEDAEITAFVSRRKTPEEAVRLASGFHEFLKAFGGRELEPAIQIRDSKIIEIMDTYELIFTLGPFLREFMRRKTKRRQKNWQKS